MNYAKAQAELKDKYPPTGVYFHNYLFPHNEKRTYRNKLTFVGENTVYLGVTLKDKTNRHWQPNNVWPLPGNNAPLGSRHFYEHNGLVLSFKRPRLVSYFKNILNREGEVKYLGLRQVGDDKQKAKNKLASTDIELSEYQENVAKKNPNGIRVFTNKNRWYILTETNLTVHPYKGKCCYCEVDLYYSLNYTRDHIVPKSRGGKAGKNLKPCCAHCNSEKGDLLLSAYIQKLNYSLYGVVGGPLYEKIQLKIKNANAIALSLKTD